ncbi:galactose-6-phosphate isomerase subunit LacB [Clostridium tertium]|jgi:galactose-6-phosphate isomerase|uniref:galactose-6-phosphate isomerase subunit LacB n=1 Tax=Clostridium TaxID=1485 RepID=UPI0018ABAC37|nr:MULTISPECIES: galactose-6-phosphate isomerase subunit LacB [Clostridium]MBS5307106.1 galactose-6-phosphate isomerase subunit LacB [Clostridium sp.]MDB1924423.1 galactose-6-phosphate isomerase subunit LacB [Clostridium tertium]MDB1927849.1 galactose-6-phosphate isomerase subunit LacB [Clostridium tertium]MDB1931473.1 galactose-6-phosphate isomerase subunit LacB [Clostridium tertium]MDB1934269.1 galactose-6-phosphate isomerase subunit LacB [Clostridium tertium]
MIISVGCDHIVTEVKDSVVEYLKLKGHEVIDNGTYDKERTHYPIYGKKTAEKVVNGEADLGIVICGTGVGITNSAAKIKGARVALVRDIETARYSKENLDINILGFGGRITGIGLMENIIDVFFETKFNPTEENKGTVEKLNNMIEKDYANGDEHYFDEFNEKWDRGEYHD